MHMVLVYMLVYGCTRLQGFTTIYIAIYMKTQEEGKAPQLISYQDDVPTSNNPLMEFVQR